MPELPEVETVRRTLGAALVGRRVSSVEVRRADYVSGGRSDRDLLVGGVIDRIERRGKQFAVVTTDGRAVCVHLGMSGQALVSANGDSPGANHVHIAWRLNGAGRSTTTWSMRDPRRFGGVWTYPSFAALQDDRWSGLGPDGLEIDGSTLHESLRATSRCVKGVLLDQRVIAGVGNIYCDEALHRAGIRPHAIGRRISRARSDRLATAIRETLLEAIEARGSTIRDYRDANGEAGGFRSRWRVYGRAGEACLACGGHLKDDVVAQRTTVWCGRCQRQ